MFGAIARTFGENTNVFGYEISTLTLSYFQNSTYGDLVNLQPLYDKVSQIVTII